LFYFKHLCIQYCKSGDRVSVGARFPAPLQTGPGVYPTSYKMGTGSLSLG